jgi:iron-sulfur cluster repair protein YtfE (RIC family)
VLRGMLDRVEMLARKVLQGKKSAENELVAQAQVLDERLRAHMQLEEQILAPALREADGWGAARVERFHEEHARQRQIMDGAWGSGTQAERSALEFALIAWGFVRLLREDMAEEERISLNSKVLRDDPTDVSMEPD